MSNKSSVPRSCPICQAQWKESSTGGCICSNGHVFAFLHRPKRVPVPQVFYDAFAEEDQAAQRRRDALREITRLAEEEGPYD
jgi:hypothetical protein